MRLDTKRPTSITGDLASQESLAERIRARILARLGSRIRQLEVVVSDQLVCLKGECSTYYTKQLAQHVALGVIEDETLENRIEVGVPLPPSHGRAG